MANAKKKDGIMKFAGFLSAETAEKMKTAINKHRHLHRKKRSLYTP